MRILVALVLTTIIFMLVDCGGSTAEQRTGVVLDKHYKPSETHYGTSTDSKGRVHSTTNHTSEEFIVMVECTGGEIVKVDASPKVYYHTEKNKSLTFTSHYGYFTGWVWSNSAHDK